MHLNHVILGGLACLTAVTVGVVSTSMVDEQFERGGALQRALPYFVRAAEEAFEEGEEGPTSGQA